MAKRLRDGNDPLGGVRPDAVQAASKGTFDAVLGLIKLTNGIVSLLAGLLAAALILYSAYVIYDSYSTSYKAYSSSWDLLKYKPEIADNGAEPTEGKDLLSTITEDYRAWLTMFDTHIDYPVVQGNNDIYYASHDIYKNTSLTGSIYLAAGNDRAFLDSYNVIYGHHMDNGAMFGALDEYRDAEYYERHKTGVLITESGIYDLMVFAVIKTDAYESEVYGVGNRAEAIIRFLKSTQRAVSERGTQILQMDASVMNAADKIVALSTCDDAETNGRLVVLARMTRRSTTSPETEEEGPFKLTIRYEFIDGTVAHEAYTGEYMRGEKYTIQSPVIKGYTTPQKVITGTMGDGSIVRVVIYFPMEATVENIGSEEDYEKPLGVKIYNQMGVLIE